MLVDPTGSRGQEYVEACQVCYQPWRVLVMVDASGEASIPVKC